eukprot:s6_g19.t1
MHTLATLVDVMGVTEKAMTMLCPPSTPLGLSKTYPSHSKLGRMPEDATKPGSMQVMFSCLLLVRLVCAYLAPIMDCDETFNYVEPIHYVTYGSGMQTWEYSPEFALRSYAYVELYALPVRAARFLGLDKVQAFYLLRASLGTISAACEAFFCAAVSQSFGRSVGLLTFGFLAGASGMFHSSVAVLPSSTCMAFDLFLVPTRVMMPAFCDLAFGLSSALLPGCSYHRLSCNGAGSICETWGWS